MVKKRDGWLRREMGGQEERWVAKKREGLLRSKKRDGWLRRGMGG